jgi:hypothetical protein
MQATKEDEATITITFKDNGVAVESAVSDKHLQRRFDARTDNIQGPRRGTRNYSCCQTNTDRQHLRRPLAWMDSLAAGARVVTSSSTLRP